MKTYHNGDIVGLEISKDSLLSDFYVKIIRCPDGQYFIPFVIENPIPVPIELIDFYSPTWLGDETDGSHSLIEDSIKKKGVTTYIEKWQVLLNAWQETQVALHICGLR